MCLLPYFLFGHVCGKPNLVGNTSEIRCYEMVEDYVENLLFELSFLLRVLGLINVFTVVVYGVGRKNVYWPLGGDTVTWINTNEITRGNLMFMSDLKRIAEYY